MELWKMKQNLTTLGAELRSLNNEIVEKTANPAVKIEEIRSLKQNKTEIEERFNLLKAEIDKIEEEQRNKLQQQNPISNATNTEERMAAAKAEFIRGSLLDRQVSQDSRNLLGAIGTSNSGAKILPTNMQTTLITEPLTKNPLRGVSVFTNIKGLVLPKINYSLDDDDFITDESTAKEINLEGDQVVFGRKKFKVKARLSDTVIYGTDTNLVNFVENALQSGLAAKEKKVAFATAPKSGEEHMSFYSTQNAIKTVEGADKYKAIKAAIADLHEDYRENAKIIMRYADYLDIIETLANGSTTLYGVQPEQVLGKPVVFCDSAVNPIVGDLNYSHFNYDIDIVYDSDKDIDKGEFLFVLTGWFDHQIKLKSAFRIAKVKETP